MRPLLTLTLLTLLWGTAIADEAESNTAEQTPKQPSKLVPFDLPAPPSSNEPTPIYPSRHDHQTPTSPSHPPQDFFPIQPHHGTHQSSYPKPPQNSSSINTTPRVTQSIKASPTHSAPKANVNSQGGYHPIKKSI